MQTPSVVTIDRQSLPVASGQRIRVLIVDDSLVIRRFLTRVLAEDSAFQVAGYASNGSLAMLQEAELHPDVITMDIEMPEMDGLATVAALRARGSKALIIMCSTLTKQGAQSTIEALLRGANDYVTKPDGNDSMESSIQSMRLELIPKIKQFFLSSSQRNQKCSLITASQQPSVYTPRPVLGVQKDAADLDSAGYPVKGLPSPYDVVAIGVSTGGPTALLNLLPRLPANFPLPIVIVQHMPPIFTRQLAERLNTESAIEVLEAEQGMALAPGKALLAPGGHHMQLKRLLHSVHIVLTDGERENSCRPAVDVLFRSVHSIYGSRSLAVILTGMGQDGLRGTEALKKEGAYVIAQDQASSVVWGMPGAIVEAGLADRVVGLNEMASAILRRVVQV